MKKGVVILLPSTRDIPSSLTNSAIMEDGNASPSDEEACPSPTNLGRDSNVPPPPPGFVPYGHFQPVFNGYGMPPFSQYPPPPPPGIAAPNPSPPPTNPFPPIPPPSLLLLLLLLLLLQQPQFQYPLMLVERRREVDLLLDAVEKHMPIGQEKWMCVV
jgi:hypothetical protein